LEVSDGQGSSRIVGTSYWADGFYLPILKSHDAVILAAICGRDEQRARELAHKHGVEQVYTDYQAMLGGAALDAVCVVTPEDLHHPMVMAGLAANLHVLCEKPMAFSAAQSAEMLAAAEQAGVKHMVQFTNRGLPHYRYVKQLLDDGYVGEPCSAYFYWPSGWGPAQDTNPYHWAQDARRAKGAATSSAPTWSMWLVGFLGGVVRVSASHRSFVTRTGPAGEPMDKRERLRLLPAGLASGAHGVIHVGTPNIAGPGLSHTGR
jgi:predicted dehydrogenase